LVEGIKNIWNGIAGFFTGLWDAIMLGPEAAIEYIRNAFFGLFNSIQEKLFGFINKVREGWETVKGFFGGVADGVVNFFTGGAGAGGGAKAAPAARPVNDMIVTPEGRYSAHPDDYIMAMKNPGGLIDSLLRFLGGIQPQPAYAGSASQAAMAGAVGQTSNYAYTTMGGSSTVNAQTSITVNVPPGTPREQSESIARQVDAQFNARLADSINSSRANIPSPEVRRR
jgi:hypothetical protein